MDKSRLHRSLRSLAVVTVATAGLFTALVGGRASGTVAVFFPPWWDAKRIVEAAAEGGPVLRLGWLNLVVLVASSDAQGRDHLWRAGAWLLLDPAGLAGCGSGLKSNGD